jgi:hypothetical protein
MSSCCQINIRSCSSNRELRIACAASSLLVELVGPLCLQRSERGSKPTIQADFKRSLLTLANRVAHGVAQRRGGSIEGDFILSVTCTALGNVVFDESCVACRGRAKSGLSLPALTMS